MIHYVKRWGAYSLLCFVGLVFLLYSGVPFVSAVGLPVAAAISAPLAAALASRFGERSRYVVGALLSALLLGAASVASRSGWSLLYECSGAAAGTAMGLSYGWMLQVYSPRVALLGVGTGLAVGATLLADRWPIRAVLVTASLALAVLFARLRSAGRAGST